MASKAEQQICIAEAVRFYETDGRAVVIRGGAGETPGAIIAPLLSYLSTCRCLSQSEMFACAGIALDIQLGLRQSGAN